MNEILLCACPHCDVMFRLTNEKLSLSNGMVRCGVCRNVFDARAHMLQTADFSPAPSNQDSLSSSEDTELSISLMTEMSEMNEQSEIISETVSIFDEDNSNLNPDSLWAESSMSMMDSIVAVHTEMGTNWTDQPLYEAMFSYMQSERSGTAMIVFADNSMGRVYLENGVPTAARYRIAEGKEAFKLWADLEVLTIKFHENLDNVHSDKGLNSVLN